MAAVFLMLQQMQRKQQDILRQQALNSQATAQQSQSLANHAFPKDTRFIK
jgi:hypothetical protein